MREKGGKLENDKKVSRKGERVDQHKTGRAKNTEGEGEKKKGTGEDKGQ